MAGGTENVQKSTKNKTNKPLPYVFIKKKKNVLDEPTCASVHFPHLLMLFLTLVPHRLASPVKI